MTRLILALLAGTSATPAFAQHGGHAGHPPTHAPVRQPAADPHAGHRMPAQQPGADPQAGHQLPAQQPAADPHAGHQMPVQQPAADPHAGHQMPQEPPTADPHAGHGMPAQPAAADPHAGNAMGGHGAVVPAPPVGPPPPGAFSGPANAADAVFGAPAMRSSQRELIRSHGRMATQRLRLDRLELGFSDRGETYAWDADFFYGEPMGRLWLKSEGEGRFGGELEHGEVQALWSLAITPFFDLQAGARYDFAPDPNRAHLVLGLQGAAPYWFEIDAAAFLSNKGELTARIEGEYDLLITQRLILQPRAEVDLSAQDIPDLGTGTGISAAEVGLRLRYEIVPEFAPYVGVQYEHSFGRASAQDGAADEGRGAFSLLTGLRFWF